jgi:NAD(P)-dependent dehydrogenase (short-subunit alcohol dehydrogenase family)
MPDLGSRPALVLGGRNLGGAIADRLAADGRRCAVIARSADTLAAVAGRGHRAIEADAADPASLETAIGDATAALGPLDLIVNAVSAGGGRSGPFGGGPIADADLAGYRAWAAAVPEQAFVFLSTGARALRAAGGGTLIQVTGGSARRALPGKGPWAAACAAVRALSQAAAQELRAEGIHVALLIVDATIASPKTQAMLVGAPEARSARQEDVAAAVAFLASQSNRGYSHELTVTPAGDTWTP